MKRGILYLTLENGKRTSNIFVDDDLLYLDIHVTSFMILAQLIFEIENAKKNVCINI